MSMVALREKGRGGDRRGGRKSVLNDFLEGGGNHRPAYREGTRTKKGVRFRK